MSRFFRGKIHHVIGLLLIPIFATALTLIFRFSYFISIFLYLSLPILYLSYISRRRSIFKTGIFALIFAIPLTLVFDYVITRDGGWLVPDSVLLIFKIVPLEDLLFGIFSVWAFTLIYEYFFEKREQAIIEPKIKSLMALGGGLLIIFLLLYASNLVPNIPYAFLISCSGVLLIPLLVMLYRHPRLVPKFFPVGVYFFFVSILWELTALHIGQWTYPGKHYIGWLEIMHLRLPLEEFFFFWIVYAAAILAWYEFFDDDEK